MKSPFIEVCVKGHKTMQIMLFVMLKVKKKVTQSSFFLVTAITWSIGSSHQKVKELLMKFSYCHLY